jgi:hypothetical protein
MMLQIPLQFSANVYYVRCSVDEKNRLKGSAVHCRLLSFCAAFLRAFRPARRRRCLLFPRASCCDRSHAYNCKLFVHEYIFNRPFNKRNKLVLVVYGREAVLCIYKYINKLYIYIYISVIS